jgi:hypothetical protein
MIIAFYKHWSREKADGLLVSVLKIGFIMKGVFDLGAV